MRAEQINRLLRNKLNLRFSQDLESCNRISFKYCRKSIGFKNGTSFETTKYLFILDGMMTDVVQSKIGFTWKNVHRATMSQIIDELVKSLK